jgi:hypothetical protein
MRGSERERERERERGGEGEGGREGKIGKVRKMRRDMYTRRRARGGELHNERSNSRYNLAGPAET